MVPTGTLRVTSSPSRPVLFEPSPWRPRSALYSGLKRKWTSVLWRSLDSMMMSPPRPPSPPEGTPRGTNFSRRKAMQPLPPPPAFTRITASSINIQNTKPRHRTGLEISLAETLRSCFLCFSRLSRLNQHVTAIIAFVHELDHAGNLGEQSIVLTPANVRARLDASAALRSEEHTSELQS